MTIAALVGHAKGSVTSKYIHRLDTALIMAADTISGYIQGLMDGIEFKQIAYALDRDSRKAALARFLKRASGSPGGGRRGVPSGGLGPTPGIACRQLKPTSSPIRMHRFLVRAVPCCHSACNIAP